jgi:hypothetical protein
VRKGSGQPDPVVPEGVTAADLDRDVQAELYGLGKELSRDVGAHLAAVAVFIEDDPVRAWAHAVAARRRASRLGIVRETAGLAAYRAGRYSDALAELRTARRMTGSNVHLPVMADAERGMGRPERAIEIVRSPEATALSREGRIELAIVESGARADLGQLDAALVAVRLPELDAKDSPAVARLRFAYSEALRALGRVEEADDWRGRAFAADRDGSAGLSDLADAADDVEFWDAEADDQDDDGDDSDDDQDGAELVEDDTDAALTDDDDEADRDGDAARPEAAAVLTGADPAQDRDDTGSPADASSDGPAGRSEGGAPGAPAPQSTDGVLVDEFEDEPEVRAILAEDPGPTPDQAGETSGEDEFAAELEEYELTDEPRAEQDDVQAAEAYTDVAAAEETEHVRSVAAPDEKEDAEVQVERAAGHQAADGGPDPA